MPDSHTSPVRAQLPKGITQRSPQGPYWADFFWHGHRIRLSTGCHTLGEAVRILEQWQRHGPPDRHSRPLGPQGLDDLRRALERGVRPTSPRLPQEIPTEAIEEARFDGRRGLLLITHDYTWQPKSHHQGRDIPIPFRLRAKLQDLLANTLTDRFPEDVVAAARSAVDFGEPPLLFCGREGGILRHNLNNLVIEAAQRAGIAPPRLHDLRHSYATWLRRNGTELATIQKLLGQRTLRRRLRA